MTIVIVPPYPQRNDPNFATVADSWNAQLPTWTDQVNATAVIVTNNATTATTQAGIATTQAGLATTNGAAQVALATTQANNAANSAANAAATANVTKWISGTTYTEGINVWSPLDFKTYRRKITGVGTTDPSSDPTNWQSLVAESPLVFLTNATANNSLYIEFTELNDAYSEYIVEYYNLTLRLEANFSCAVKTDGTWRTSNTNYYGKQLTSASNTCAFGPFVKRNRGRLSIKNPSDINNPKLIFVEAHAMDTGSLSADYSYKNYYYNSNSAVTGLRFFVGGVETISTGTFTLYGLK